MAIKGKIILEDLEITFILQQDELPFLASYTITDIFTGTEERCVVDSHGFMAALAMALQFDGGEQLTMLHDIAETAMPSDANLRWIP